MTSTFNRAIKILLATNALILLAPAMFAPIYALYVEDIGGNLLDAALTGAIFALAAGVTTLLAGHYADKKQNHKIMIIAGSGIMSGGFLLYTIVDSIVFLFLVQAIQGFGEAIYYPAYDALYSKHINKKKAATQWGAWESMAYFTAAIGATIGGLIVAYFGFSTLFVIMAIFSFLSGLYLSRLEKGVI